MFVWKDMNHPNVIRFWGYYLSPDMTAAWLISPYAPFGSVDKYVRDEQVSPLERLKLVSPDSPKHAFPKLRFHRSWKRRKDCNTCTHSNHQYAMAT